MYPVMDVPYLGYSMKAMKVCRQWAADVTFPTKKSDENRRCLNVKTKQVDEFHSKEMFPCRRSGN